MGQVLTCLDALRRGGTGGSWPRLHISGRMRLRVQAVSHSCRCECILRALPLSGLGGHRKAPVKQKIPNATMADASSINHGPVQPVYDRTIMGAMAGKAPPKRRISLQEAFGGLRSERHANIAGAPSGLHPFTPLKVRACVGGCHIPGLHNGRGSNEMLLWY